MGPDFHTLQHCLLMAAVLNALLTYTYPTCLLCNHDKTFVLTQTKPYGQWSIGQIYICSLKYTLKRNRYILSCLFTYTYR